MRSERPSPTVEAVGYPSRDEREGTYHHVGTRGNNGRPIYRDAGSRVLFLLRLSAVVSRHDWTLITYCLMDNHYHLVIKLGGFGMAQGMQELNGGYAIAFNMRYGRRDHLFGRRYWNRSIESDDDLLETSRYIELNPCRRELTTSPEEWEWSGYRAAAGIATPEPFHRPAELWGLFDRQPRIAMSAYERFVREGLLGT
jgi:REP element-mobilizing transposase RayT